MAKRSMRVMRNATAALLIVVFMVGIEEFLFFLDLSTNVVSLTRVLLIIPLAFFILETMEELLP